MNRARSQNLGQINISRIIYQVSLPLYIIILCLEEQELTFHDDLASPVKYVTNKRVSSSNYMKQSGVTKVPTSSNYMKQRGVTRVPKQEPGLTKGTWCQKAPRFQYLKFKSIFPKNSQKCRFFGKKCFKKLRVPANNVLEAGTVPANNSCML